MWDEVSLQAHVQYDQQSKAVIGFEDWGTNRTSKLADHALVFTPRGIYSGSLLPLSYSFADKQTIAPQLVRCITEHAIAVTEAGFTIIDEYSLKLDYKNNILNWIN